MPRVHHMATMVVQQTQKYNHATCLKVRNKTTGIWEKVSWLQVNERVRRTAQALIEYGVERQSHIGVYSENMDKFIYCDLAAFAIRAITVPMYATSSPSQVKYIVEDANIRLLFVGSQLQYNNAYKVWRESDTLKQLIVFDPAVTLHPEDHTTLYYWDFLKLGDTMPAETEVKVRRGKALPTDVACMIYTSGTSGVSKGVELTHANIMAAMKAHIRAIPHMSHRHTSMNFLPLTHVFEKMWVFLCMQRGVKVAIGENPKEILRNLTEVRPHFMCNAPRFWEKVYIGVKEKIDAFPKKLRKITEHAVKIGRKYHFDYIDKGIEPPLALRLQYALYDKTLFSKVKKTIGIENGKLFPTAGAALSDPINMFLQSIGIPITIGYGLTETTATVTFCRREHFKFGSIGTALDCVEVRIDPETEEIQVKGDTVMRGYYNKPEQNEEAFTADGWFRTGDMGYLDAEGNLFFKERLKDLYKTANAKYIAPQQIENLLTGNKYLDQVMLIAEGRSFVSALISPNWEAVRQRMEPYGIQNATVAELAKMPEVQNLIEANLEDTQKDLASFEKVKRFYIVPEAFSIENGLLTNTLKMRRSEIMKVYAEAIEEMYNRPYTPTN